MTAIRNILCLIALFWAFVPLRSDDGICSGHWNDNKYSMFIHFGLYSHLGGVWDGVPVTEGYSEQIQSFAGIFSDWYAMTADDFDPVRFDADEIASLAKQAGMRSVIFTSKHHDGFCMFRTATTDYSSVVMTPSGRDYVRELSDACRRAGLNFGLYFSLIDWHYPQASPISSHNADFITPEHHEYNKSQVRELLTGYGPVSELWFDMGALTPAQSDEMYRLVKELQPDCMVSGRLGNDRYDFAVMADNRLPRQRLHAPWQSAVSMFPETWSWRSWQERGSLESKISEKLRTLTDVVSRGGNFLLNIGPQADGSVVDFERDVLLGIGKWLKDNGDAIYGSSPVDGLGECRWGTATAKGNVIYLLLSGVFPEDGKIILPESGHRLRRSLTEDVVCRRRNGRISIEVRKEWYGNPADVKVLALELDRPAREYGSCAAPLPARLLSGCDAVCDYSYSCFDYYSNYRSTVAYGWNVKPLSRTDSISFLHTASESGRKVLLEVEDDEYEVVLGDGLCSACASVSDAVLSDCGLFRMRGGTFDAPVCADSACLRPVENFSDAFPARGFTNWIRKAVIDAESDGIVILELSAGNGVELVVNGRTVMKHLNPYGQSVTEELVAVSVQKGRNEVMLRSYNRFGNATSCSLLLKKDARMCRSTLVLPEALSRKSLRIRISALDTPSVHADCRLHNVRLLLE